MASLGFSSIFADVVQPTKVPNIQDVQPLDVPPRLADFQEDLKKRMREVLDREGVRMRTAYLPTVDFNIELVFILLASDVDLEALSCVSITSSMRESG